jgi:hypothetical protein
MGRKLASMSEILAIVDETDTDEQLVEEIALRHPHRVTVLLEEGAADAQLDDSPRGRALSDRLATLLAAIEQRTGAVVVGLAGSREQLSGWRFDRIVGAQGPIPAL